MTVFEQAAEIDLTDIDLSNISENISNAGAIWEAVKTTVVEYITDAGINLVLAVILLIVGWKAINFFSKKIKDGTFLSKMEPTTRSFFRSFVTIFLKILLVITVAAIIGIPMTSMVTVLSSCALAIGLALQDSLSNIAGGFIVTAFKPFVVGDYIKIDGYEGTVKSINIFYTKIVTGDNKMVIIPNGEVSSNTLTDYNAFPTRRVDIDITASYSADCDTVKKALLDAAHSNEYVLSEPAPTAVLTSFDDSAVAYQLKVWCNADVYWDVKFNLMEKTKKIFEERNIEIPFPQMDVHITKE
ncbi:MAG: mechanosensitive ion channel family protein [Clostridia bacterium]|nr:mechanosensitive ion channel family protein [Clostridia bacterium]